MRIISGTAKGTKLYTLEGESTRPTLDRVKESIFNIIQYKINNSIFLDLFSGSGAIGLEAASRGAKKVVLCDKSQEAVNIIKKNAQKTHLENKIDVYNKSFDDCLKNISSEKFNIIYLDPPYKTNFIEQAIELILKLDILEDDATIIVETDNKKIIDKLKLYKLKVTDQRKYGRAIVVFIEKI